MVNEIKHFSLDNDRNLHTLLFRSAKFFPLFTVAQYFMLRFCAWLLALEFEPLLSFLIHFLLWKFQLQRNLGDTKSWGLSFNLAHWKLTFVPLWLLQMGLLKMCSCGMFFPPRGIVVFVHKSTKACLSVASASHARFCGSSVSKFIVLTELFRWLNFRIKYSSITIAFIVFTIQVSCESN